MSMHPVTQYAMDVLLTPYGDQCCELEKLACRRHLEDLKRAGTDAFPYVFDETRADRILDWYRQICRHVRGPYAGQPIEPEPWQVFDHGCLYGWVHRETGARRFNIAFHMRGRGNVKSTENSADCLYSLCADAVYPPGRPELARFEASPEISCAAVDRDQAKRVWGDAKAMAEASPDIASRLEIHKHSISHGTRGGWMLPLSKDLHNKDSGSETFVSIDEYHAWLTSQIKDDLYSGFGKRMQSLMSIITTAGLNAENNPCRAEQQIGERILRREICDESYFVMVRTLDKDDDPHDEKCWPKPNPILRIDSVYSRGLYRQIKVEHDRAFGNNDYAKRRNWLTKRMNRWQATAENKYLSDCMDRFKALAVGREEFAELVWGQEAYTGLDLSRKIDLTADGYVIPLRDGRYAICGHGFMPEEGVRRHRDSDRVPYDQWGEEGWCTITPGEVTDFSNVEAHMHEQEERLEWSIKEICYDPYQATQYAQDRDRDGYTCVEIRQGMPTLSEPTKLFREYILQGKLVHDGSPLMLWCFGNALEESDSNGNIRLSKRHKDDSQRIDVAAAILNAFVRAITHEFNDGDLFYVPDV